MFRGYSTDVYLGVTLTYCLLFSFFVEDLVLAEERTTEKDKKRIYEGNHKQILLIYVLQICLLHTR